MVMVSLTIINSPLHEREEALASTVRGFFLRRRPLRPRVDATILPNLTPDRLPSDNLSWGMVRPGRLAPALYSFKSYASALPHAVRDEPCLTRLTTLAAMPASTALACGDFSMSIIGFDPCACP